MSLILGDHKAREEQLQQEKSIEKSNPLAHLALTVLLKKFVRPPKVHLTKTARKSDLDGQVIFSNSFSRPVNHATHPKSEITFNCTFVFFFT